MNGTTALEHFVKHICFHISFNYFPTKDHLVDET